MLDQIEPKTSGTCNVAALAKNIELGRKLNVDGTPTIFLADGRRLQGAVPADMLNKELVKAH